MSKFRKSVLLALVVCAGCAGRQTAPGQFSAAPIPHDVLVQTGTDGVHTIVSLQPHTLRATTVPESPANRMTAPDMGIKLPQLPGDALEQWPMMVVSPDPSRSYTMLIATPDPDKEYTMLQVFPRVANPAIRLSPDMLTLPVR